MPPKLPKKGVNPAKKTSKTASQPFSPPMWPWPTADKRVNARKTSKTAPHSVSSTQTSPTWPTAEKGLNPPKTSETASGPFVSSMWPTAEKGLNPAKTSETASRPFVSSPMWPTAEKGLVSAQTSKTAPHSVSSAQTSPTWPTAEKGVNPPKTSETASHQPSVSSAQTSSTWPTAEKDLVSTQISETASQAFVSSAQTSSTWPTAEKGTNPAKNISETASHLFDSLSGPASLSPTMSPLKGNYSRNIFQSSPQPTILGYVKNVSPTKHSAKGSEYFSFTIQEKHNKLKALCFSPQKHKSNIQMKAESGTPCKITKFNRDPKDDKVIWINYHTNVDQAVETTVDFSQDHDIADQAPPLVTTKDVNAITVFETVCARGLVMFGDNTPQRIPAKPLTKLEGRIVDETGSIPITIWNEHIELVRDGEFYIIQNMVVKQYYGQKYLSSTSNTQFERITEDLPTLSPNAVKEATDLLTNTEVRCSNFRSVDILTYYSCLNCSKRLPFRQDSVVLKCKNCQNYCLIKNSSKTMAARVSTILPNESDPVYYSLFQASLEAILKQHHLKYGGEVYDINNIEEDKLSEIILMSQNIKLRIKNDQVEYLTFE